MWGSVRLGVLRELSGIKAIDKVDAPDHTCLGSVYAPVLLADSLAMGFTSNSFMIPACAIRYDVSS
jgi:hypothetical protein